MQIFVLFTIHTFTLDWDLLVFASYLPRRERANVTCDIHVALRSPRSPPSSPAVRSSMGLGDP